MAEVKPNYALWEISPQDFPQKSLKDQLKTLITYGSLAASSHNTQPWKFSIKDNVINVYADLDRALKAADPTNKELYISVGCTIPNLEIAAAYFGFTTETKLLPNPKNQNHIASITLNAGKTQLPKDSLFTYLTKRLTNRSMFKKGRELPPEYITELNQTLDQKDVQLKLLTGKDMLSKLADITRDGLFTALSNPAFRQELSQWVRHSWTDKGDGLPANTLGIPNAASIAIATMVRSPLMPKTSSVLEHKMILSSSAIGVLFAPKNDLIHWIKAGITYSYVALITCKHKLAIEPLSAAIEVPKQRQLLKELVKETTEPMMFFRIGFAKERYPHAPRRQLDEIITHE